MEQLVLLPNLLDPSSSLDVLPQGLPSVIENLDGLIAESEKEARRYLIKFLDRKKANDLPVHILSEHTTDDEVQDLVILLKKDERWGLISDCGLPSLADPGARLVRACHHHQIGVSTLPGPSSLIMALQLSGLSQKFFFHGYLPRKEDELKQKLLFIEKLSSSEKATQMWIEAPYRTKKMLMQLLSTLSGNTTLCLALDLATEKQRVICCSVKRFRKMKIDLHKERAVFLIEAK